MSNSFVSNPLVSNSANAVLGFGLPRGRLGKPLGARRGNAEGLEMVHRGLLEGQLGAKI